MDTKTLFKIFNKAFDDASWLEVLKSVFGAKLGLLAQPKPILLKSNDKADAAFELGSFTTTDDRIIGLYKIEVKPEVWLERNKVGLRELLRNVYQYDVDGAIIVFVQQDKWRLSFVSEIKVLNDEGEIVEQATEPKRYTYLLGEGEKVRTPSERLSKLAGKALALQDILDAFSVEALNEEFYKIIQAFFYKLVGGKIGKGKKLTDYGKGILQLPSVPKENRQVYQEFAVRLIGRTVFCWFLKMKKSDADAPLLPENLLSSKAAIQNSGYYHNILERLFFQTLNTPIEQRVENLPEGAEQIPFLNGGLFEPGIHDYYNPNKVTGLNQNLNTLKIDDQWFVEFFQELEKYNFTIDENSVTDVEVSVDPEMLGRIFENLLAEIDPDRGGTARKATGSFYTPREIVDYMATESLVQYIHNKTDLPQDQLRPIFKMTDQQDFDFSKAETEAVLDALDQLKILDPACGSGAFPMGVLQKIVQVLQKLDPDAAWWKKRQVSRVSNAIVRKQLKEKLESSSVEYARKIGVIQNSLYGVDIQPVAAEISKLRCFLSLVVDENIDETKPNRGIEPLPNLEFKFVTADTLTELPEDNGQRSLFDNWEEMQELEELRNEYIQSYGKQKQRIKERFLKVQQRMFKDQMSLFSDRSSRAYQLITWNPFGHEKSDWFDPKWMFGVEKFDVVIGNPPYIQLQKNGGSLAKKYEKQNFDTFQKTGDIYSLFYEKGWQLLKPKGVLIFITSNKWMRAGYGEKTRKFFAKKANPLLLIDFAGQKIFETATVDVNILMFTRDKNQQKTKACIVKEKVLNNLSVFVSQESNEYSFIGSESWVILSPIEQGIKRKIEAVGTPLKEWDINIYRGILTGYNEAFIIDGMKKQEILNNCITSQEREKTDELIRPLLRGRDIKRYSYEFADKYLLFIPWHFPLHNDPNIKGASLEAEKEFENQYPAIYRHLLKYKKELSNRNKAETGIRYEWYALQRWGANYWEDFYKQKIAWNRIASEKLFSLVDEGIVIQDSMHFFTGSHLVYLACILNSSLYKWNLFMIIGEAAGGNAGNAENITNLPVFKPSLEQENLFKILFKEKRYAEIDQIIYKIYNLTLEEIEYIENITINTISY